jgi:hypothetical protein
METNDGTFQLVVVDENPLASSPLEALKLTIG